jgi:hypothetical protein
MVCGKNDVMYTVVLVCGTRNRSEWPLVQREVRLRWCSAGMLVCFVVTAKDSINKVEAVQRWAARFATGDYQCTSSVTVMLQQLQWQSLQSRQAYQRSTTSTAPLFEPEAIHYDSWYHTQELQCTWHHSSHHDCNTACALVISSGKPGGSTLYCLNLVDAVFFARAPYAGCIF